MSKITLCDLIDEAHEIKGRIAAEEKRLKAICEQLLASHEPGEYSGTDDRRARVFAPGAEIKLADSDLDATREAVGGDDNFKALFERNVTFKPKKGFREIAGAILKKPALKKLFALVEKQKAPFVKFSLAGKSDSN